MYISKKVGDNLDLIVAPLIPFGISRKTREFPGSIMLQFETFKHLIEDILINYLENGFKKLIIFSFHGSSNHLMALNEAAYTIKRKWRNEPDVHIYIISSKDISDNRIFKLLKSIPIHSGELETSIMLYLSENLVKIDKVIKEEPKFPDYELLLTGRPWMKSGVMGDPVKATKEKGESIIKFFIENLTNKIRKIIEN